MKLRLAMAMLGAAALSIALFLTYERARGGVVPCPVGGGCETVARSAYAPLLGLPVSVYGIAGSAAFLATFALRGARGAAARTWIAGVGFAFSAYLTYLEAARIHAYCAWCVTSAIVWTLLLALTLAEAWRETSDDGSDRALAARGL